MNVQLFQHLLKRLILPTLNYLGTHGQNQLAINIGLFLDFLFYSIGTNKCPYFCQYHTLLIAYFSFLMHVEISSMSPSTLFFFFKIVLAILGSMSFYVSLGSAYQFLPNKQPGSWYGLCWLCRLTCRVLLYNNIKYSSPWTQDVFDFLQVFISFYQWCFVVSSAQVLFILLLSILVLLMLL